MVDYSKFDKLEASDSDDEKQTVDPDKAEAWLRKYDELAKDQSSDSDSDSDAEPTIAGVDWAKEGATRLGPDKYDAMLRKRDAKLKNPIPGDATWLTPTERRRLMRHASPGPTGALFAGEQFPPDLKDAEAVPAAILHLKDPWPSVDAAQLYAHARVAKKLDATCSARLREDLASRTHLRLALARYFVSHNIDATGPTNRPVCEKAIDACWESIREAAAGKAGAWDAAWAVRAPCLGCLQRGIDVSGSRRRRRAPRHRWFRGRVDGVDPTRRTGPSRARLWCWRSRACAPCNSLMILNASAAKFYSPCPDGKIGKMS